MSNLTEWAYGYLWSDASLQEVLKRLNDYERIGLEPEEMAERLLLVKGIPAKELYRLAKEYEATALQACPFCGGTHVEIAYAMPHFRVWCKDCGARGADKMSKAEAIAMWNGRAEK